MDHAKWRRLKCAILLALAALPASSGCDDSVEIEEQPGAHGQGLAAPVTVSFQNGVAPTASYGGMTDATIRQAAPTSNLGSATTCRADGDETGGNDLSCLLRWDLTGIPAGSTIQSASIALRAVESTAQIYSLYALLRSWDESSVTWNRATAGSNWASAGAKGSTDRGSVVGTVSGSGGVTIALNAAGIALVQSWLNAGNNRGIVIANASNSDGVDFASSEHGTLAWRPKLTVTYVPPEPVDAGGAAGTGGATGAGGSGGGTSDAGLSSVVMIARGAAWRYLDNGGNQGTAWRSRTFDDASWSSGPAQLGYGDGDEATVIASGPAGAKFITSYFRRRFDVANPSAVSTLTLSIERDDGAVVYLNGTEVYRTNMPSSSVTSTTLASTGVEDGTWFSGAVNPSGLVAGSNVIAVEVHQSSATSSDVSFDFELMGLVRGDAAGDGGDASAAGGASGSGGASGAGGDAGGSGASGAGGDAGGSGASGAGGDAGNGGASGAGGDAGGGGASGSAGSPDLDAGGGAGGAGGSSGAAGDAGSSGTGGAAGATEPNLLVAFIGDEGDNSNADAVLELIKREGASAAVHNGDFDYEDNPASWNGRVDRILGPSYPYFAVIGNHDAVAWNGASGYASLIAARHARVPEMQCEGELGVKANCTFRGLQLIESCVGTSELRASCGKNSTEQVQFIHDALAARTSLFSMCLWHKNQADMQVGTKSDEVGWNAYAQCAGAGAIIATAHEHSYARTKTLTNIGVGSAGHGATGAFDLLQLGPGRTFVFVSGIGGSSIRPYDASGHDDDSWWASYYTSDRWVVNGTPMSGVGTYGALFIRFNVDGNPRRARAYFKDLNERIADEFTIEVP